MPHIARLHYPGALVHLIARFLNHEFLLAGPAERAAYLARIPAALARTDWTLLAFALMSSHVHMVLVAGQSNPWLFYQSLHTSFAGWWNGTNKRLGPVFSGRPTTIYSPPERLPTLVTYVHNNPVRANLVSAAENTDWTSHRIWLGLDPAPAWLNVESGLAQAGFDATLAGRAAFNKMVFAHAGDPRDPTLSGTRLAAIRARARTELALPVELASPVLVETRDADHEIAIRHLGNLAAAPRWSGDLEVLVERVAAYTGIAIEALRSKSHLPGIVRARRLAAVVGVMLLRRRNNEVAATLGVSNAAICQHLAHVDGVLTAAKEVEAIVRSQTVAT